jgi:RNA polymerase sigma-70 factor, ECF subfamily
MLEKVINVAGFFKPKSVSSLTVEDRFHQGDMAALETIMNTYQTGIYRLGLRLFCNRDKAADFCQDVFIKAHEKCGRYNPALPIKPWLFQMAVNLGRDQMRRKQEVIVEDGNIPEPADPHDAENTVLSDELKKKVWQVVNQLGSTYREVIALRFSSDLSMQEIADTLGIKLPAAKVRLCRGLKAFEEAFKAQGGKEYVV